MDGREPAIAREPTWQASTRYRAYVLALLVAVGIVGWVDRNCSPCCCSRSRSSSRSRTRRSGCSAAWHSASSMRRSACRSRGSRIATSGARCSRARSRFGARSRRHVSLATGAVSLFVTRVAVGIGEAGGAPPSVSLVADYFPRERRAFALGVLYLYIPSGSSSAISRAAGSTSTSAGARPACGSGCRASRSPCSCG